MSLSRICAFIHILVAVLTLTSPSASAQNFTLSSGVRSSVIVPQSGSGTYTISVVPTGGFSGSVTFTASGLPTGVTASFSPAVSTSSTTLTLTANATATLGTKDFTVTGTSGALTKTAALAVMVTAADQAAPFSWPAYDPDLNFDSKSFYPDVPNPTAILNDTANVVETVTVPGGTWCFRYGPNKNPSVTAESWIPMLNRLNNDFAWLRDNMGWPADLRHRSGYYSTVYLFGSGMGTDTASNTEGGGWMGATNYQGRNWPMILMSYIPVISFKPSGSGDPYQQGATVHEGIHALFADAAGVKNAPWFHESGNTYLQGEMTAQITGDYSSMGWLSAASMLAPFMPVECYSGWLQDGSFGGPGAEGVAPPSGSDSTWRRLFGGTQYGEAFPHFLTEMVSKGSVGWIWQNAPGRVLEGMADTAKGGMGAAQIRRLIMEYRARGAICDFGAWSGAYQKLRDDNWNTSISPEGASPWINADPWVATCYQPTTNNAGVLTPESKTLPAWTGANYIPLTVTGTVGSTVSVDFTPLGNSQIIVSSTSNTASTPTATTATSNNMTCQLVYRAADGSAVYGQPVSSGTCSIRLNKAPRSNVVIAVITSTDYLFTGDDLRKRKFDYRLALGSGVTGTASVNTKWYQTVVQPAVTAIAGDGENHVFWSPVSGATSYTLKRATTPGGPYTNVFTGSARNHTDTGRVNGTTYYYIATASNATQTSVPSNEVSATPFAPAVVTPNFGFQAPVVASASMERPSGASWTFTGVAGIASASSGYISGNRPAPQGNQVAFLQNTGSISQTISGFTPGSFYTVRFLASQRQSVYQLGNIFDLRVDGATVKTFFPTQQGTTWQKFEASFTATATSHTISFAGTNANGGTNTVLLDRVIIAPAASPTVPGAPTNLAAKADQNAVSLTWDYTPLTASYTVKRSTTSGSGHIVLASNIATTSYTDASAVPGTIYYYVVSANNSLGTSGNSNEVIAQRSAELQVHLKFDESSGTTAADSSGNGRNATLVNATWGAGKTGNAMVLNGTNGHATLPTGSIRTLNDYTIATWVKLNSVATWSRIFDFGTGASNYMFLTPQFDAAKSGKLRFGARAGSLYEQAMDSATAITAGTWTHLAVTLSGVNGKMYVNGVLSGSSPAMPVKPSSLGSTTPDYIGRSRFSANPYLNGSVDDFRIYNRALTEGEISALANPPAAPIGLAATGGPSQVSLTWNAVADATSYNVKRGTESGGPYTTVAAGISSPNYTDPSLTAGTTYYYIVTAQKLVAESVNSTQASATSLTPGQAWRQANFNTTSNTGDAADSADPDKDGITNLMERAFGGNPNASEPNLQPSTNEDDALLTIRFRRAKAASDLNITVQVSSDLSGGWTSVPLTPANSQVTDDGDVELVRVTVPPGSDGKKFLRVQVSEP